MSVVNLIETLCRESGEKRPLRNPEGLWADLGVDITEEDIAEVRREMWGKFPREFPKDDSKWPR